MLDSCLASNRSPSLSTVVVLVSAPLAGWVSDRIGSRRLLFSIPFVFIAILMLFPFRVVGWQIFVFMGALGLIAGAVPTATFAAAPEIMGRPDLAGLGLAVVMVGQDLGMFAGPILFGNLVERLSWAVAGYWLIPVCILGFLAASFQSTLPVGGATGGGLAMSTLWTTNTRI